jgi:hypothetical protein
VGLEQVLFLSSIVRNAGVVNNKELLDYSIVFKLKTSLSGRAVIEVDKFYVSALLQALVYRLVKSRG